jgi:hypothetical protein
LLSPVIAFLMALTALVPGIVGAGVAGPAIGASFPVYADSASGAGSGWLVISGPTGAVPAGGAAISGV